MDPESDPALGPSHPGANGRAPAAVDCLETDPSPEPDGDALDAVLCYFGNDSEKPLADLRCCVEGVAADAGCEPRELLALTLWGFRATGAVTVLPSDGAGGGEVVRLDLSKSAELRQRVAALLEEVDALVRVGGELLADGQPRDAEVLQVYLESAVSGRRGVFTRRAIVDQALDRIATSPEYETWEGSELTVYRRKRAPEAPAPDGGGAKASQSDTEQPPPGPSPATPSQ
jgi:hypothetical protein